MYGARRDMLEFRGTVRNAWPREPCFGGVRCRVRHHYYAAELPAGSVKARKLATELAIFGGTFAGLKCGHRRPAPVTVLFLAGHTPAAGSAAPLPVGQSSARRGIRDTLAH